MVVVAARQVLPLSMETYTRSLAAIALASVPEIVCMGMLVAKSLFIRPLGAVSALSLMLVTVLVGAVVSTM